VPEHNDALGGSIVILRIKRLPGFSEAVAQLCEQLLGVGAGAGGARRR